MLQTEVGGRKLKIKKKEESEGEIRRKEVEKKEGGRKWESKIQYGMNVGTYWD